jgi:hypothetical protein
MPVLCSLGRGRPIFVARSTAFADDHALLGRNSFVALTSCPCSNDNGPDAEVLRVADGAVALSPMDSLPGSSVTTYWFYVGFLLESSMRLLVPVAPDPGCVKTTSLL